MPPRSNISRDDAVEVPRKARAQLFLAVFLIFAPIMTLVQSALATRSAAMVAVWFTVSGLISLGYALSGVLGRRWLLLSIPLTAVSVAALSLQRPSWLVPESPRLTLAGVTASVALIGGYILFVRYIRGEGSRSLRMRTELRLAGQIHDALVPPIHMSTEFAEVFGRSNPSYEMGGDLIDVVNTPDRLDIYLADVSGHGVRAGVLMAMIKSSLRTRLLNDVSLGTVVRDLNRVVPQVKLEDMFATFAAVRLAPGAVECCLAGHLPLLWYRAATGSIEKIDNDSLPLGVVDDETFQTKALSCSPGDVLVLYTDGLIELRNQAGDELGIEQFSQIVKSHASKPLPDIFAAIIQTVNEFGSQADDQTLALVRIK